MPSSDSLIPFPAAVSGDRLRAAEAFRAMAGAFAHLGDFPRFVAGLEGALGRAGFFDDARVRLFSGPPEAGILAAGRLALPLVGAGAVHGALDVGGALPASRPFGAEDLHLLSALAAVLAAAMDHAALHGGQRRELEALAFLFELAPVGLVALPGDGSMALANAAARSWLGVERSDQIAARLAPDQVGVDWRVEPQFHLRLGGRLIFVEARSCGVGEGRAATAFVLADLGPQQALLMDGLQRELYRCRWLGLPFAFALLESRQISGGLLQRLPALRAELRPGEFVGPYDAHRIGVALPGLDLNPARARLRQLARHLPVDGLQAALVRAGEPSAEHLLGTALAQMLPADQSLRRTLLLHDDSAAVNDSLALVLRRGYGVVKTSRYSEAVAHLRTQPFDGLVTEVDLRDGPGGLELARLAKRLQPSICPIFTTVAQGLPAAAADPVLAGHLMIRKPFDALRLEEAVAAALAAFAGSMAR